MNDVRITESNYRQPIMRRLTHVSERELVLLNFIRNQANRLNGNNGIAVRLEIGADSLKWEIGERW